MNFRIKIDKIFENFILNIIGTLIPMFILQLFYFPLFSKKFDTEEYGLIITTISLMNFVSLTFANAISNSKIILNSKNKYSKSVNEYNVLLAIFLFLNITIIFIIFHKIFNFKLINICNLLIISTFTILNMFLTIDFRINLDYRKIFISNVFQSCGFIFGFIPFYITQNWMYIYLFGNIFNFVYLYRKTTNKNFSFKLSGHFKEILVNSLILLLSSYLLSSITYLDRFIIYPFLGLSYISIYFVSTIFGKSISMIFDPINNVFLSYLSNVNGFDKNKYNYLIKIVFLILFFSYFFLYIITIVGLKLFYYNYIDLVILYIPIVTITNLIIIFGNFINTILLKFSNSKYQIYLNTVYLIIYLFATTIFIKLYNFNGLYYGVLTSSIFRLIIILYLYIKLNDDKKYLKLVRQ